MYSGVDTLLYLNIASCPILVHIQNLKIDHLVVVFAQLGSKRDDQIEAF